MADTKNAPAADSADAKSGRPTMPDEAAYQKNLKAAEAEHKKSMDKLVRDMPFRLFYCSDRECGCVVCFALSQRCVFKT